MNKYAKIYTVPCRYCGSGIGRACRYINSRGLSSGVAPHKVRIDEASRVEEARYFSAKAAPAGPALGVGDIVLHLNEELPERLGYVIGFGPDPRRWIKVKTGDGKTRIWARQNLYRPDQDLVA